MSNFAELAPPGVSARQYNSPYYTASQVQAFARCLNDYVPRNKTALTNCKNCGARLASSACEYCDTRYLSEPSEECPHYFGTPEYYEWHASRTPAVYYNRDYITEEGARNIGKPGAAIPVQIATNNELRQCVVYSNC